MRVYVAGPYSDDPEGNLDRAAKVADEVEALGHVPFVPHLLGHAWEQRSEVERDHAAWLRWCLTWLPACDVLLRIPGESPGADQEVGEAIELGKPVLFGLAQLRMITPADLPERERVLLCERCSLPVIPG